MPGCLSPVHAVNASKAPGTLSCHMPGTPRAVVWTQGKDDAAPRFSHAIETGHRLKKEKIEMALSFRHNKGKKNKKGKKVLDLQRNNTIIAEKK